MQNLAWACLRCSIECGCYSKRSARRDADWLHIRNAASWFPAGAASPMNRIPHCRGPRVVYDRQYQRPKSIMSSFERKLREVGNGRHPLPPAKMPRRLAAGHPKQRRCDRASALRRTLADLAEMLCEASDGLSGEKGKRHWWKPQLPDALSSRCVQDGNAAPRTFTADSGDSRGLMHSNLTPRSQQLCCAFRTASKSC